MEYYEMFELKEWIQSERLDDHALCFNPNAISFLEKNPKRIKCKSCLSANPGAIPFLQKHPEYIDWVFLALNPEGVNMIERNYEFIISDVFVRDTELGYAKNHPCISPQHRHFIETFAFFDEKIRAEKLFWLFLSLNPNSIFFLEKHLDKIHWSALHGNPNCLAIFEKCPKNLNWFEIEQNPNVISIIERLEPFHIWGRFWYWSGYSIDFIGKHIEKANWRFLSENPNVVPFLEKHKEKICWPILCLNPNAISFLEKNMDKIHWPSLCSNPKAIHLLEKNVDKIDWFHICRNPNAVSILLNHSHKIVDPDQWFSICENPNVHLLIQLLEKNLHQIHQLHWQNLLCHRSMSDFIKKHAGRVDWSKVEYTKHSTWILENYMNEILSSAEQDPDVLLTYKIFSWSRISLRLEIFGISKKRLKERSDRFREELEAVAYSPDRIAGWKLAGYDLETCI